MNTKQTTFRLPFNVIEEQLYNITIGLGFEEADARLIARTHTQSSCDGVYSHGLNRFPRFVEYVKAGHVKPNGRAKKIAQFGSWERWDGHQGAGIPNAHLAIKRAIELAKTHGMGAVALRNTNHWMRAGTYGWMAAEEQCMAICMTNTIPNMPPWGGIKPTIGNNPVMLAVPRQKGPVVLDIATSQFSYGKMEDTHRKAEKLPYPGGWDKDGKMTDDPGAILENGLVLPTGYWKGSGLSILMDMMVSLLADGQSSHVIGQEKFETGLSQLYFCIDVEKSGTGSAYQSAADAIIDSVHAAAGEKGKEVYYPGEQTLSRRSENLEKGVPLDEDIWQKILGFAGK